MSDHFMENFNKKYRYECVRVCDYVDLLSAVKTSVSLADEIKGHGFVFLYVSKWEDIELLPYLETLFFGEEGERITEDEYEELDDVSYETYWVYPDLELAPYLGDNGRNNVVIVYQPDEGAIDKDFEGRVKLLQTEFKPLDWKFKEENNE